MAEETTKGGVPENVKKELGRVSKDAGIEKTEIAKMYKEIFKQDYLAAMQGDARHEYALMILKGQLHAKIVSDAQEFEGQVIDYSSVRLIKKEDDQFHVGNLYMRLRTKSKDEEEENEEEFRFAEITMWRDQCGLLKTLERGKWYSCSLRGTEKEGMYKLSSDESTNFQEIEQLNGEAPLINFIDALFDRVPLAEFDDNLSKGKQGDYKMAVGTIVQQRRGWKEDRDWGTFVVVDETLDLERAKEGDKQHQGFTTWVSGEQSRYKPGSVCQIIGRFNKNSESGDRTIDGKCINPILASGTLEGPFQPPSGSGSGGAPDKPQDDKELMLDDV